MRRKFVTPTGDQDLDRIFSYIFIDNPAAAERYHRQAVAAFFDFPDMRTPRRAGDHLPEYIHTIDLMPPFQGYSLRVAILSDAMYLLAAFAPGLPDRHKNARTYRGLREI